MKEPTGDLAMTIVVIVGVAAVLVLGRTVIWPAIRDRIEDQIEDVDTDPSVTYALPVDQYIKI